MKKINNIYCKWNQSWKPKNMLHRKKLIWILIKIILFYQIKKIPLSWTLKAKSTFKIIINSFNWEIIKVLTTTIIKIHFKAMESLTLPPPLKTPTLYFSKILIIIMLILTIIKIAIKLIILPLHRILTKTKKIIFSIIKIIWMFSFKEKIMIIIKPLLIMALCIKLLIIIRRTNPLKFSLDFKLLKKNESLLIYKINLTQKK
jgi:hypothetical protein